MSQAGSSTDPALGLRAVVALRGLVEQLEDLQVARAREQGWSWADIAAALGIPKQAAHKKHRNADAPPGTALAVLRRARLTADVAEMRRKVLEQVRRAA